MANASHGMMETRCREHWYPDWTAVQSQSSSIIRSTASHWLDFLEWYKCWYGLNAYTLIWDGFMTASLTTASFVIPKIKIKTWLWLHRQIRDVHRDSAIDIFVEGSKLLCMSAISLGYNHTHCLTRAHILTPEMRNSTLNKIWYRRFTNGMRCRVWGTVLMRLLADPSVSAWLTWSKSCFHLGNNAESLSQCDHHISNLRHKPPQNSTAMSSCPCTQFRDAYCEFSWLS